MSLHKFAEQVASQGRGEDSLLVHMTPDEVRNLQRFAQANGRSLTVNPTTGLPEAGMLSELFKAVAPIALGAFLGPAGAAIGGGFMSAGMAGLTVGGITTLATGSLSRGLMAGLGAYGGAGLGESLMNAGTGGLAAADIGAQQMAGSFPTLAEGATQEQIAKYATDVGALRDAAVSNAGNAGFMERASAGLGAIANNPAPYAKDLFKYGAAAAAPIMADMMTPTTTKMPELGNTGYIRQKVYDPYTQTYTSMAPIKASEFGSRQLSDLGRGFNGGGIVALAHGGVPGYADGMLVSDQQVFDYFAAPGTKTDAQIAADMQTYNVGAADIARITGTQAQQGDYEKRFVQQVAQPDTTAAQFLAATSDVGLQNQGLATALQNSGLSAAAQYAATHSDIGTGGGLAGLSANINTALADPKLTREAAQTAMTTYNISDADVQRATGQSTADIFAAREKAAADAAAAEAARLKAIADKAAADKAAADKAAADKAAADKAAADKAAADKAAADKAAADAAAGRHTTCPAPEMRILLASGELKAAGELQVGDVVRTQHEHTLEWGDYPVTHVSVVPNAARFKFKFDDVDFVCSLDHKFFKAADKWVDAKDVRVGNMISGQTIRGIEQAKVGDVIRITIDDAHTYICEGLLSHNKSPKRPSTLTPDEIAAAEAARLKAIADKAARDKAIADKAAADKAAADKAAADKAIADAAAAKAIADAAAAAKIAAEKAAADAAAKALAEGKTLAEATAAAAKAKAEADAIAKAIADKAAADAAAAANKVTSVGTVDLLTNTGVTQDTKDTTTTGTNTLATTTPGAIKSSITTDGTYVGTTGVAPAVGTKVGEGTIAGTGTETTTGTTGPIINYGGTAGFSTAPLTLAQNQLTQQAADTTAAQNKQLDLYRGFVTQNPNATDLEHANFMDKINLSPDIASKATPLSGQQMKNRYYDAKYNKMTGDSQSAYNFLMGKGAYPTKSGVGEIMRPYSEATLGMPASTNQKYIFDPATKSYKLNQDYVGTTRDATGAVNYTMSPGEIASYFKANQGQADSTTYDWAIENGLNPEQIAAATGVPLSTVAAKWRDAKAKKDKAAAETKAAGITSLVESGGDATDSSDDGVGPGQGPGEGGDGGTGGCVDPDVMVLLATGGSIRAGDLKVGDALRTLHEDTLEYGDFPVEFVEIINQPKLQVSFKDGQHIVVSTTHKFLMQTGDWKPMHDVAVGEAVTVGKGINQAGHKIITEIKSLAVGPVVKMTVTDAHTYIADGLVSHNKARGGRVAGYAIGGGLGSLGSYSDGGRLLRGPGDGVSDSIPATIGQKQQPARLADGEFVVPARIVSELGNGSTDAGAKKLYAMLDRVQRARGKTTGKNKVAANSRADKHLPA